MVQLGHWKICPLTPPPVKVQIVPTEDILSPISVCRAALVNLSPPDFSRRDSGTRLCTPPSFRGQKPKNAFYQVPLQ